MAKKTEKRTTKDRRLIEDNYKNTNEMVTDHRGMTKGLITGTSEMTNGQAHNANNAFGKQLAFMKLQLEAYKLFGMRPESTDKFLPVLVKKTRGKK